VFYGGKKASHECTITAYSGGCMRTLAKRMHENSTKHNGRAGVSISPQAGRLQTLGSRGQMHVPAWVCVLPVGLHCILIRHFDSRTVYKQAIRTVPIPVHRSGVIINLQSVCVPQAVQANAQLKFLWRFENANFQIGKEIRKF